MQQYLDVSSIQEGVLKAIEQDQPGANYTLVLKEWKFLFKKVANTHEFYFDIFSDSYSVQKATDVVELQEYPTKMVEDEEVYWNFQYRKRRELEEIIKHTMRIKKISP